jgi:hypothetical protein
LRNFPLPAAIFDARRPFNVAHPSKTDYNFASFVSAGPKAGRFGNRLSTWLSTWADPNRPDFVSREKRDDHRRAENGHAEVPNRIGR